MPPAPVDWTPALVVLGVGIALGIVFMWRALSTGRPVAPPALPDLELRDLEAKRDALISQLRELEDTAAKRSPAQLASERYALELEAARAWLALDERRQAVVTGTLEPVEAPPPAEEVAPAAATVGSAWKGFLWGVGSLSAVLALVLLVSRSAEQRPEGGSPTGGTGMAGAVTPAEDAELTRLQAAVAASPEDVATRLDLARLYLMRQDMMAVFNETQQVLERQPDNPRALAYQALVRMAMGQGDQAESMLKRALAADPDLVDGYIHLMLVYMNQGRSQEAEATLATASQRFPEQAESLARLFGEIRTAAAGGAEPPASAGPAAQAAAPAAGTVAPAASGRAVKGVLTLDASAAARLAPGAVVYVMLRPAGVRGGPPLAAIRLVASGFPLAFAIGDADSMTGDPIPDSVLVEARVDRDGDVATRDPGDPYGSADGVTLGTVNLQIVLKPAN